MSRERVRELAEQAIAEGDATGWFERLYAEADGDPRTVPWADLEPSPWLETWISNNENFSFSRRRTLVVGCGLGDDAERLSMLGARVTAFDISRTAIGWCEKRFPSSSVHYEVADLFDPPGEWANAFDFVFESFTLQSLPEEPRRGAVRQIGDFVAPCGTLLIICRAREPDEPAGNIPWHLTKNELDAFVDCGLEEIRFDDFMLGDEPSGRRFRIEYKRPA